MKLFILGLLVAFVAATEKELQMPEEEFISKPHPCDSHPCGLGQECLLDDDIPYCTCIEVCDNVGEVAVCGTDNVTYSSMCELFRHKCVNNVGNLHLDYYQHCREIEYCSEDDLVEFPHRMSQWFKNVMEQFSEVPEEDGGLTTPEITMLIESELEENHFRLPIHWKFLVLDFHPHDGFLTHTELAPLRAPLVPLEHCASPFFLQCDSNHDQLISLREWGHCMGLKDYEVSDLGIHIH